MNPTSVPAGDRAFYDGARLAWPQQQIAAGQEGNFNQENRMPPAGYGGQPGGGTPHVMSPEAHREQPVQQLAQQEQRGGPNPQHAVPVSNVRTPRLLVLWQATQLPPLAVLRLSIKL